MLAPRIRKWRERVHLIFCDWRSFVLRTPRCYSYKKMMICSPHVTIVVNWSQTIETLMQSCSLPYENEAFDLTFPITEVNTPIIKNYDPMLWTLIMDLLTRLLLSVPWRHYIRSRWHIDPAVGYRKKKRSIEEEVLGVYRQWLWDSGWYLKMSKIWSWVHNSWFPCSL